MEKVTLTPYLLFDGNCREAMNFYHRIFGGNLEAQTFGEVDNSCPAGMKDHIMHSSLMGGEIEFMAGDNAGPQTLGTGKISMAISGYDENRIRQIFTDLSEGGNIVIPLEKQVWGDLFGVIVDRFDVNWMINIGQEKN